MTVGGRDTLDAQQDDHGVWGAAAVVRGETRPEGKRPFLTDNTPRTVHQPLVRHVPFAVGLHVLQIIVGRTHGQGDRTPPPHAKSREAKVFDERVSRVGACSIV